MDKIYDACIVHHSSCFFFGRVDSSSFQCRGRSPFYSG
uniref:Uncharacterized protein n=1 Tax=Arundo donax TaxID=35708 RepID=A0A0A9BU70_ARUDO